MPKMCLMYFLSGIDTKKCWNIPEFTPLRVLNSFIRSFANAFAGIVLTFFEGSFNSFLFKSLFFTYYHNHFC